MNTPTEGTLIHGTMRAADLIPAFLAEFKHIDPNGYAGYLDGLEADGYNADVLLNMDDDHEWYASDDATELVDELFTMLDERSPEGCYFGAHPGDGCDYGYWRIEE
jgi:hypothetical protein